MVWILTLGQSSSSGMSSSSGWRGPATPTPPAQDFKQKAAWAQTPQTTRKVISSLSGDWRQQVGASTSSSSASATSSQGAAGGLRGSRGGVVETVEQLLRKGFVPTKERKSAEVPRATRVVVPGPETSSGPRSYKV